MTIRATYKPDSGFSDYEMKGRDVIILGFVVGTYEPGYQRSGTKTTTLAIIADEDGAISQAELRFLRYIPAPPHEA